MRNLTSTQKKHACSGVTRNGPSLLRKAATLNGSFRFGPMMPLFCHLIFLQLLAKPPCVSHVESSLQVPGFRITWSTDEAVLSPDGQFAYLLGNNAVTLDDPTGQPVTTRDVRSRSGNEEPTGNGAAPWTSGMRSQLLAGRDD